jgi:hypothetical protein
MIASALTSTSASSISISIGLLHPMYSSSSRGTCVDVYVDVYDLPHVACWLDDDDDDERLLESSSASSLH